jgi:hypothetical protein
VKQARLMWTGLALVVVAGTAALALASGMAGKRASNAKAASGCATASAQCTPAQKSACASMGAAAAADCPAHGGKGGTCAMTGKGAEAGCSMGAAKGAAMAASCPMSGTKVSAASSSCCAPGTRSAASAATAAIECDACADMAACESDIAEAGGKMQVVPLKNGLMYVYSAESSAKVRAVQAAVARHAERLATLGVSNDKARLCNSCREMRGAAASGKLTREVVNIESGCLTLVTSNDPQVVARLFAVAGLASGPPRAAAIKS